MIAAKLLCENSEQEFAQVFARQYCLTRHPLPRTAGWKSPKRLSGWGLTHCPKLKHVELHDSAGDIIGWFLGVGVDQAGNLLGKAAHKFQVVQNARNFWDVIEAELTDLAGRYIAFVVTKKGARAYFDPVMDLPAVFNRTDRMVGSSPLMALPRPFRTNRRLNRRKILKQGGNYGMQQTCDPDVQRALTNHYLDLESFSLHRYWPREEDSFDDSGAALEEVADRMVARLGQITGTLLENYSCLVGLTGGLDSRTLAFSARESLHHADLIYAHRTTWISQIDCYLAKQIADELGLGKNFGVFDAVKAIEEDRYSKDDLRRMRWNFCYRTGFQNAPKDPELVVADILPETDYILRGNILDMARANQWPRSFEFDLGHGLSKLVLGGRSDEENLAYWGPEYQNWMDTLPASARSRMYDLAFTEQLLPNTLGGRLIGYHNANYINPFNDRRLIQACIQVGPVKRKGGALNKALHHACGASKLVKTRQAMSDERVKAEAEKMFV